MTADLPPLLLALLLLAAVCVAQQATVDHEVRLNADQCNAMGRAVAASQLPSSPCFDKTGGQLGINQRSVRHAHPLRVKTAKNKQNGFLTTLFWHRTRRAWLCAASSRPV
jgi:hypothetical protein